MSQTPARKVRREITKEGVKAGVIAPKKRGLDPQELLELQEIQRICAARAFEANQVRGNTARFPRVGLRSGKQIAAELTLLAQLLEDVKRQWIQGKLVACGYPSNTMCDINLSTGSITVLPQKNDA